MIFDELNPSALPHIEFTMGEDILQALVISVDLTSIPHQKVLPCFESMNNCGKLQVMCGVVQLVRSQLSLDIRYDFSFLHENTPKS